MKKSKKKMFKEALSEIVSSSKNVKECYTKYKDFISSKSIYNKEPKNGKKELKITIIEDIISKFLKRNESPKSIYEYRFLIEEQIEKVSDEIIYKYKLDTNGLNKNLIKIHNGDIFNRFNELNPYMVEINDILSKDIPDIMKEYSYILTNRFNELQDIIRDKYNIQGEELLFRLPYIQKYLSIKYEVLFFVCREKDGYIYLKTISKNSNPDKICLNMKLWR